MSLDPQTWESALRTLRILQRDLRVARINQRWKSLLTAVYRHLRQERRRKRQVPIIPSPDRTSQLLPSHQEEIPAGLGNCLGVLRVLARSPEDRRLAEKLSNLPEVIRHVRRELRLDLRGEPRRHGWNDLPHADQQTALEFLQALKDEPSLLSEAQQVELWPCIHGIRCKVHRFTRRKRLKRHAFRECHFQQCAEWLPKLTAEPYPTWDYHEFKGLLAKVERAFEKDRRLGRSSVEERRAITTEDAGSSPAAPNPATLDLSNLSWWERFRRWLKNR